MDEVKKKVWLDLFAAPSSLLPIAGGVTLLIGSWAVGGSPTANFLGVAGVLGGLGLMASRLILGIEKITNQAYLYVVQRRKLEQDEALDALHQQLLEDRDPRTEHALTELRTLYTTLQARVDQGEVGRAPYEVLEHVDRLFRTCVHQLQVSVELWQAAHALRGPARQSLLQRRDEVVQEVADSVVHLGSLVERFLESKLHRNSSELRRLRSELDQAVEVARRAELRTAEWEQSIEGRPLDRQ